ncbi:hypothetical protein BD311DRAFT_736552 [Dichomitus squalens]|uniref:Uncharacterized protein n=1 Tax=Dichomitus squalens TaxID=114155 RepID=A0A4Q9N265_9APHY|nr:hypothetical protein BD311DRAFT_736552 [Dichomitus squalens]
MMRGATDLRNTKFEIEDLRREIVLLHSQIESSGKEKDELSQRLKAVKDAAKQSLQASSKSLEAVRTAMGDLKTRSEESFGAITNLRASIPDVQELRNSVSSAIESIQPHLEPGKQWAESTELKNVMKTLELECSRSQQVADLLRDRLQSVGGELVEAKGRIAELEAAQSDDRAALRKANDIIRGTTEETSGLAASLKEQQDKLCEVLAASAEYEAKLQTTQERLVELQELVARKDAELQTLQTVQHENARLLEIVAEKDACVASLRDIQPEVDRLKDVVVKNEAHAAALRAANSEKDSQMTDLGSRLKCAEGENAELNKTIQDLKSELGASNAHGQAVSKDNERLLKEKGALTDKINDLESALGRMRQELADRTEKLQQANVRRQSLEERFEDQAITLRLTRESAGDAQERLLSAEAAHAKALAEVKAKLESDVSVLQEQKLGLQTTMDVMDVALKRQEASLSAIQEEHADRLKQQESTFASRLEMEEKRLQQLAEDLREARSRATSAEDRKLSLDNQIRALREQLHQVQLPCPETETELRRLRSLVATLEAAEMKNILRAKTLDARYRVGDLNDEEKAFIQTLIQTSQAIHEQELVASRNELRRRDNALKEMRAKAHRLEITLAKHLNDKKAVPIPTPVDHSMIDPTSWMSSAQSSSPAQAPDRDGLQPTNVDIPISTKRTSAVMHTDRRAAAPDSASVHVTPGRDLPAQSSAPQGFRKTTPPDPAINKNANKPYFSRLATDCSDEILDFDDDVLSMRKPTPPSSLGKRRKSKSPFKTADELQAPTPFKRLRSTVRKTEMGGNRTAMTAPKKSLQASGSKPKARKRR